MNSVVNAPKGRRKPLPLLRSPQPLAGDGGAIAQCPQFCPNDAVGHLRFSEHRGAKTAIDPGNEPFAVDDSRIAADALRYQARMLNKIRRRVDDTGNKNLVVGNFDRLEIFPFVIVARISGLDADRLRLGFESGINNFLSAANRGCADLHNCPSKCADACGQPEDGLSRH